MKQKSTDKIIAMQSQSQQLQQDIITKVHDRKSTTNQGTCFLVELKGNPKKSQWVWKPQSQLTQYPGFKKQQKKYLNSAQKSKDASAQKSKIIVESEQKKTPPKKPLNINEIDKELLKEKLKKAMGQNKQQGSLQNFFKPQTKQKVDQKKVQTKVEPTIQTIPMEPIQSSVSSVKNLEQKSQVQNNQWIEKVKGIKTIKGYEFKNCEMSYEVDVWDKNGQTFFVPPLSSETVKKIDKVKLTSFLQDCMIQGFKKERMEV